MPVSAMVCLLRIIATLSGMAGPPLAHTQGALGEPEAGLTVDAFGRTVGAMPRIDRDGFGLHYEVVGFRCFS